MIQIFNKLLRYFFEKLCLKNSCFELNGCRMFGITAAFDLAQKLKFGSGYDIMLEFNVV